MRFLLWLEAKENIVYHVTLLSKLSDLATHGLIPNYMGSTWAGKEGWVAGKNFFSNNLKNAEYWVWNMIQNVIPSKYESGAYHPNNFVEERAIPVIIRFRFNRRPTTGRWQPDVQGSEGDYYTRKEIAPQSIEWWDGQRWKSIQDDDINLNLFVYKDTSIPDEDYDEDTPPNERFHWEFRDPYPFPRQ